MPKTVGCGNKLARKHLGSTLAAWVATSLLLGPAPANAGGKTASGIGVDIATARGALRDHELHTLDGKTLTLGSLRGQVVVVNFWASWCRPCRQELPALAALHAEIVRQGGRVVAISIDHDRRNVQRFVKQHALGLPVLHDGPDGLARRLNLQAVPLTMILDRGGELAFASHGADGKALDEIRAAVREQIARTPPVSRRVEDEAP